MGGSFGRPCVLPQPCDLEFHVGLVRRSEGIELEAERAQSLGSAKGRGPVEVIDTAVDDHSLLQGDKTKAKAQLLQD